MYTLSWLVAPLDGEQREMKQHDPEAERVFQDPGHVIPPALATGGSDWSPTTSAAKRFGLQRR